MEHILASHIMHHGKRHNLLYDLQHGFRDKFQDDLIRNMSNGAQTDVLIMDFAKAFDKVGHRRLLWKLNYYGIDNKTQIWVQGFLSDRTQTVALDGEKSYVADVVSGVPQGSVLGPCLFLYYINDIPVGLLDCEAVRRWHDRLPDDNISQWLQKPYSKTYTGSGIGRRNGTWSSTLPSARSWQSQGKGTRSIMNTNCMATS